MTFIVRMAVREVRASWQRLLFFFVCIAIGVASIVAIRSVIQSVGMVLTSEARALLAADMMVRSNSPFTPAVHETLAREQWYRLPGALARPSSGVCRAASPGSRGVVGRPGRGPTVHCRAHHRIA